MNIEVNISKCGSYCHLCPAYIGDKGTEDDRKRGSQAWERYFGLHFKPEAIKCRGCQSTEPWKSGNMLPSRMCVIRACAIYNEMQTCANCVQFPCREYGARIPAANLRELQEKATGRKFSDQEYLRNIEPFEGRPHLNELRKGLNPDQIKNPKPVSGGNLTAFPTKTSLNGADFGEMRKLYSLLSGVLTLKAPNYAEQILLERRQPCALALLWSLAYYGILKDERLLLDSQTCRDKKECTRFVRKTDNQLHNLVKETVGKLAEYGLIIKFTPTKKDWQLTLEMDPKAGGTAALASLRLYVKSLAAKYGEPVYVNSYNLKGKAFKLFARLDMQDF